MNVEIIDFNRPDSNRKKLFISSIPASINQEDVSIQLHAIFDEYGLVYGVQVYPTKWTVNSATDNCEEIKSFYAFVTFYSWKSASKALSSVNGRIWLEDTECKVSFAKRKQDIDGKKQLHFTRCYDLVNYYLGFNCWSASIKTLFEDKNEVLDATSIVKYVCMVELNVKDLKTDGIGLWQESFVKSDPLKKIQSVCKCKKISHQRAIENAFAKLLLIVLDNGKVTVEVDTTIPEFHVDRIPQDQLIKASQSYNSLILMIYSFIIFLMRKWHTQLESLFFSLISHYNFYFH
ncbi:RAD52 motif-containing protein [Mactra antiquata]